MNILFLGDVVGRPGRKAIATHLPKLLKTHKFDCIIVNGENAAGGFGITEAILDELMSYGADAVTLGNHSFDKREIFACFHRRPELIRPINYPEGTPGAGSYVISKNNKKILVVNAMGRVFMDAIDDPFRVTKALFETHRMGRDYHAAVIDFHAEATSEKQAFANYFDGQASLIVGTHTHAPTADHRILAKGTGYMSDVGMCGDYDSILGMEKDEPIQRFITKINSQRFEAAKGEGTMCGIAIQTDAQTGACTGIEPVRMGGALSQQIPAKIAKR